MVKLFIGKGEGSADSERKIPQEEHVTRAFVNTIRQVTPSYQRKILLFLAKNPEKKFTNIQIAHALEEDRSNVWRFINSIIEDSGEHSMIEKTIEEGDVYYSWREPGIKVEGMRISKILRVLGELEKNSSKEEGEKKG